MLYTLRFEIVSNDKKLTYERQVNSDELENVQGKISQLLQFVFEEKDPKEDEKNNNEKKNGKKNGTDTTNGDGEQEDKNKEKPPSPPPPSKSSSV